MENMTSPGTLLSGDNATWLEDYYQTWLRTPEQLPEDWRRFFLSPELTVQSVSGDNNVSGATLKKQAAIIQLINAWRTQGHLRVKRRTKNAKAFHDKCENFSFRASNETAVLITAFYSLHGDHLGYG
ncbi:hypothetical protein AZS04_004636 [Escherichia coli]|nr:hypothetical protein [Escherichia coli]